MSYSENGFYFAMCHGRILSVSIDIVRGMPVLRRLEKFNLIMLIPVLFL